MSDNSRMLAVFDFDNTLIEGDSLWPFLIFVAGKPYTFWVLLEALFFLALHFAKNRKDLEVRDWRTFLKAHLLRRLLKGKTIEELNPAIEKLFAWQKWNEPVRAVLLDHHNKGHQIVIASGGLDLYLPALIRDLPPRALICTRVEVINGTVNGLMTADNCVRQRKAEILANYIEKNGPFIESWGYGNYPHDLAMLDLLDHRIIVS